MRTTLTVTAIAAAIAVGAAAALASARPDNDPFPGGHSTALNHTPAATWDTAWAAPSAVSRIGTQVVRCDSGEGNLGGAGTPAPATLPSITTCTPASWTVPAVSAAVARQLEHDPLR